MVEETPHLAAAHLVIERAAPVAMLFEAGKVVLHDRFPELGAGLLGMIAGGDYERPGVSPDRADALVWALLMLGSEIFSVSQEGTTIHSYNRKQ